MSHQKNNREHKILHLEPSIRETPYFGPFGNKERGPASQKVK